MHDEPQHILFVHTAPGIPLVGGGGGSRHLREVIRAMDRAGHRVTVVTRRLTRDGGNTPHQLPCKVLHYPQGTVPGFLQRFPQIEESAYDSRLWRFLRMVAAKHRPTLVYERYSLFSQSGMRLARALRVPGILEVNAPLLREREQHEGLNPGPYSRARERSVLRSASRLIAVSSWLARYLESRGVPAARIQVIPNGVDTTLFAPRERVPLPAELAGTGGGFVVGFCGTLKPWHDLALVLESLATVEGLEQARLLVIGDGPQRGELERRATQLSLDSRVIWAGERPEEQVPELLAACDAVCVPSAELPEFYFSPLKMMEAMAMGLPVVATDIGDASVVAGGAEPAALLVPPGSAEAFGAALLQLVGDEGLRRQLGQRGRARALLHTWDQVVRESLAGVEPV